MQHETTWTDVEMVDAFNEWMRLYTEDPEDFAREFQTVARFIADGDAGRRPSYGRTCTQFLKGLAGKIAAVIESPPAPAANPQPAT